MRLGRSLCGAVVLSLLAIGSPARAQLAPGYSGYSTAPVEGTQEEYWWGLRQIGGCLAGSRPKNIVAFLGTEPGSEDENRAFDGLFNRNNNNSCMRHIVRISAPRAHFRGAVAEAMYEKLSQKNSAPRPATVAAEMNVRSLRDFAKCYVAGHPADAQALLAETKLGSQQETARIRSLAPTFSSCLPVGVELSINPPEWRMALAEALYHASASGSSSEAS